MAYQEAGVHTCVPLSLQSQSTKLCVFEERVLAIVSNTKDLPETLATSGKITLSRKGIAQLIGQVSGLVTPVRGSRCRLATMGSAWASGLSKSLVWRLGQPWAACSPWLLWTAQTLRAAPARDMLPTRIDALAHLIQLMKLEQAARSTCRAAM